MKTLLAVVAMATLAVMLGILYLPAVGNAQDEAAGSGAAISGGAEEDQPTDNHDEGESSPHGIRRLETVAPEEANTLNDRAWRMLGLRFELALKSDIPATKSYRGGLRIDKLNQSWNGRDRGLRRGDILVGLQRWEVASWDDLEQILKYVAEQEISPLKFYVLRGDGLLYGHMVPVIPGVDSGQLDSGKGQDQSPDEADSGRRIIGEGINSDARATGEVVLDPDLTYDGKGFEYWKRVWRTELKTERRTEAIRALAAFGAHGHGREAAETILDVVQNYDPDVREDSPEAALIAAAVDALVGDGLHVPLEDSFAVLIERVEQDGRRLAEFADILLESVDSDTVVPFEYLLKLSQNDWPPLAASAIAKLGRRYGDYSPGQQEKLIERAREALSQRESNVARAALFALYGIPSESPGQPLTFPTGRVGYVPELIVAVKHADERNLHYLAGIFSSLGEEALQAVPALVTMLESQESDQVLRALAMLATMGPLAKDATGDVLEVLKRAPEEMRPQVIAALRQMRAAPEIVFDYYLHRNRQDTFEDLTEVLPKLADEYGKEARPAAPFVAPFLLHPERNVQHHALVVLVEITGSYDYAKRYLERVVERLPSSDQASRAFKMLREIAENAKLLEAKAEQQDDLTGPFFLDGDAGRAGRGGYAELIREAELRRKLDVTPADLPRLIEQVQSSDRDKIESALIGLQALGEMGQEATEAVMDVARDGPAEVRKLALGTLLRMEAAPEYVIGRYAENPGPIVVRQITDEGEVAERAYDPDSLGRHYGPEAVPHLLPLLLHGNEDVRRTGMQGLFDDHALKVARDYLQELLSKSPSDEIEDRARDMIRWIDALEEFGGREQRPPEEQRIPQGDGNGFGANGTNGGSEPEIPGAGPAVAGDEPPQDSARDDQSPQVTVVRNFLKAVQRGDRKDAYSLLTRKAVEEIERHHLPFLPQEGYQGHFTIKGATREVGRYLVECEWRDDAGGAEPRKEVFQWVVKEDGTDTWRIAGMLVHPRGSAKPIAVDFENPDELMREQQPQSPKPATDPPLPRVDRNQGAEGSDDKTGATRTDPRNWSDIRGRFVLRGDVDPQAHPGESLVVTPDNRGLANVFVYLSPSTDTPDVPLHPSYEATADEPVLLELKDRRIRPRTAIVRTSQPLLIRNLDTHAYNPNLHSRWNPHNFMLKPSAEQRIRLERAERYPMPLMDNIIPSVRGHVLVTDHPYAAITDADGRFAMENFPVGDWTLQAWHEVPGTLRWVVVDGEPQEREKGRFQVGVAGGETDLGEIVVHPSLFTAR